MLKCKSN